jgi:serine/threonine-protein kinase
MDEGRPVAEEGGYPLREEAGEHLPPPATPVGTAPPAPPRRRLPPVSPWPVLLAVLLLFGGLGAAYAVTRPASTGHSPGGPDAASAAPTPKTPKPTTAQPAAPAPGSPTAPAPPSAPSKPSVQTVAVPAVTGSPLPRAVAALKRAGLTAVVSHVSSTAPEGQVVGESPAAGAKLANGGRVHLRVAVNPPVTIPDLTGRSGLSAMHTLQADGLKGSVRYVPSTQPARTVVSQWPPSGRKVRRGTSVLLNVSNGVRPTSSPASPSASGAKAVVPDVTGEDESTATANLQNAGFSVDSVDQTTSDPSEDGVVLDESPAAGSRAADGSTVTITVGRYSSA